MYSSRPTVVYNQRWRRWILRELCRPTMIWNVMLKLIRLFSVAWFLWNAKNIQMWWYKSFKVPVLLQITELNMMMMTRWFISGIVNMFISIKKIPGQCEILSEFSQPVLFLPCNIYISVMSLWLDQCVIDIHCVHKKRPPPYFSNNSVKN